MSWKRHLKILRPCPILKQVVRESGTQPLFDCQQCGKQVLNLVYNSAQEAKARVAAEAQEAGDMCVIYRVAADGIPKFAPERDCQDRPGALVQAAAMGVAALGTAAVVTAGAQGKEVVEPSYDILAGGMPAPEDLIAEEEAPPSDPPAAEVEGSPEPEAFRPAKLEPRSRDKSGLARPQSRTRFKAGKIQLRPRESEVR